MNPEQLDQYLQRTADHVDWPPPEVADDVARGRRALRRRRVLTGAGAALATAAVVGLAGTLAPTGGPDGGDGPDRSAGPASQTPTQTVPVSEDELLPSDEENADATTVVRQILDPQGRYSSVSGASSSGSYDQTYHFTDISPEIQWQGRGMERPGRVQVRVVRQSGAEDSGWQCSSSCGSYRLEGREVLTGVSDAGTRQWQYEQSDGETVLVQLYDFPDGTGLPQRRLDQLLASPDLNVPDERMPRMQRIERGLDDVLAEVLLDRGWNYGSNWVEGVPAVDGSLTAPDGTEHGDFRVAGTTTDGPLTCTDDLRNCRVENIDGTRVRIGVERTGHGQQPGWLRVEADHGEVRAQIWLSPHDGAWAMTEEMATDYVTSKVWDRVG